MDQELLRFTREALAKNIPRTDIAEVLRKAGWDSAKVNTALGAFEEIDFAVPVPRPKPSLSARETFLYLVMFAALYACAWNVGSIAFEIIDQAFLDPMQTGYYSFAENIRWNLSSLIVAFPLFLLTFRLITGNIAKDPSQRDSRPRKWLTYLTLFIVAVILAGDVIGLLYRTLGGELTIRFVLKVLTVGIIAGGVFTYFLSNMRKEEKP